MIRYIAFLRAINVGGHTVKMDFLRQIFEQLDLTNVETFIASGNVIFETSIDDPNALEKKIETGLHTALGFEVATFLRSPVELVSIANYQPFPQAQLEAATALNVAFLKGPLDDSSLRKVEALSTDIDSFHVNRRELYWLCLKKQSESTFSNQVLEKATGTPSTLRGFNTIKKLVEKYSPS